MAEKFGHISVQLLDALGTVTATPIYMEADDSKTIIQALTEAATLLSSVDAISDSQVVGAEMRFKIPLGGGLKDAPISTAENERTVLFNFAQAGVPYKFAVDIPAFREDYIVDGRPDLTVTQVGDFVDLLTNAGTVFTYVSTALAALSALVDALLSFRKHRKALSRRSTVRP